MKKTSLAKKVGEKMRELRQLNGYTQEQIAVYLEISRPYYTSKEIGGGLPSLDLILRLSMLYGVSILKFVEFHPSSKHANDHDIVELLEENHRLKNEVHQLKKTMADSRQSSSNLSNPQKSIFD